jgi:hypothetical protein
MKKALLILCILLLPAALRTSAQTDGGLKNRIYVEPGFGLGFGAVTYVSVSASGGYFFTDKLSAGLGGGYTYYKNPVYRTDIYEGKVFARHLIYQDLVFAHAEYVVLNMEIPDFKGVLTRQNVSGVLVGAGYQFGGFSKGFYGNILLLFNLNDTAQFPYGNPVIRPGFGFAF